VGFPGKRSPDFGLLLAVSGEISEESGTDCVFLTWARVRSCIIYLYPIKKIES
jgi:hypothetical protein